mmetsp:Transcript_86327/g.219887  ORF Transcript_86327/g.219887 Transcript_86327/m.219887 type:complete len:580 (-) Transcript_86327:587-2326(-)
MSLAHPDFDLPAHPTPLSQGLLEGGLEVSAGVVSKSPPRKRLGDCTLECSSPSNASQKDYYKGSAEVGSPLSKTMLYNQRERLTPDSHGFVLALVGLPARGKSFISRKLDNFLEWQGLSTKVFNVGMYRREAVEPDQSGRSDFFDAKNKVAAAAREAAATAALDDALAFLSSGGKVAIMDATNSTKVRRKSIVDQVRACSNRFAVLFVEAICDDAEILETNMLSKVKNSPDFAGLSLEEAIADIKARVAKYEDVYEPVQDSEGSYIKVLNLSSKIMASHCYGRMSKSIMPFMMAIHIGSRPIWLVRAGSGEVDSKRAGETDQFQLLSHLSSGGQSFARSLASFIEERSQRYWREAGKEREPASVLTSTMLRAVESVRHMTDDHEQTAALNPIDKGTLAGGRLDVECRGDDSPQCDFEERYPDWYAEWKSGPFRKRFPGGESYMDVLKRLESVLVEVEMSTRPVLIVSHVTVLQLLAAYFRGTPVEDAWKLAIPKNTVMEVTPTSGGGFVCEEHALVLKEEGKTDSKPKGRTSTRGCWFPIIEQLSGDGMGHATMPGTLSAQGLPALLGVGVQAGASMDQ